MADDLGDSHPSSLQQGGALPLNSTAARTVGRFYPAAGMPVRIEGYATLNGPNWRISVVNAALTEVASVSGPQHLVLTFTPASAEYHTIRIRNEAVANASQTVWIKTVYSSLRNRLAIAPSISNQPTNFFAIAGGPARFAVVAAGDPAPAYQWLRAGAPTGILTPSLTFDSVTMADAGTYSVRLLNEARQIDSATATLTVYPDAIPQVANFQRAETTFSFSVQGRDGLRYQVQRTTDFENWSDVAALAAPATFSDATSEAHQFYRLLYLPN